MNRDGLLVAAIVGVLLLGTAAAAIATVPASGDIPLQTTGGLQVTDEDATEVPVQPFVDDNTIQLTGGTISANGPATARLRNSLDANTVRVRGIDATTNDITLNTSVANDVRVSGDLNTVNTTAMTLSDGVVDFEFAGTTGTTTVTVFDLPADTAILAVEGTTILAADISNGQGTATFARMTNSEHDVELLESTAPIVKNNTASPTGQALEEPIFKIDIADRDFDEGDIVDVSLRIEGQTSSTQSIDSNQTVRFDPTEVLSGTVNYSFVATDSSGLETTSQQFTVDLPDSIVVRPLDDPTATINGSETNASATARFFTENDTTVIVRDIDKDGQISLIGLPANAEYFVQINASGFFERRVLVDSLFEQNEIFLLNQDAEASQIVVNIEDRTGDFGPDTTVQIERPINTTDSAPGEEEYRTIAGDTIGSKANFGTVVENGVRYRLKVTNPDGQQRQLGAFVAQQPRQINLVISGIDQGVKPPADGATILTNQTVDENNEKTVTFRFVDPSNETDDLVLRVEEAGNSSNVFATSSPSRATFPLGEFKFSQTFTRDAANTTLVANVSYERAGEDEQVIKAFGADRFPIGLPLEEGWATIFGVGLLIVIGGVFSRANARIGALIIPGVALLLNLTGIMSGVVTLASVGVAFAVAVGINVVQATSGGIR
jgi:hypothetical protein